MNLQVQHAGFTVTPALSAAVLAGAPAEVLTLAPRPLKDGGSLRVQVPHHRLAKILAFKTYGPTSRSPTVMDYTKAK